MVIITDTLVTIIVALIMCAVGFWGGKEYQQKKELLHTLEMVKTEILRSDKPVEELRSWYRYFIELVNTSYEARLLSKDDRDKLLAEVDVEAWR